MTLWRPLHLLLFTLVLLAAPHLSAATYVVSSAADTNDGTCDAASCTLREAVHASIADGGGTVHFAIGSGNVEIILVSALPPITVPIVIDATTQPGYAGAPIVRLTGLGAGDDCLVLQKGDSTVRGLDIGRCRDAIAVAPVNPGPISNIAIERNWIGTRLADAPIHRKGIRLEALGGPSISNVRIGDGTPAGRNNIATYGFVEDGLYIMGGVSDVTVAGNYFGLSDTGAALLTAARFTTDISIYGTSASNNIVIGGSTPGARNVFGSGGGTQINMKLDGLSTNVLVEGNYIGTDPTGLVPMRATNFGIWFYGEGEATIRNNVMTSGNTVVSRGVTTSRPVVVQGNRINVRPDDVPFPMISGYCINDFSSAPGYLIGGPNPGDGNVLANCSTAIFVNSPSATVQGNLIGLDSTGTNAIGSGTRGIATSFARTDPGVFIRDNRIAGCTVGIDVGTEAKATVDGNYVGTDASGTVARPNNTGITISGATGASGARVIITNNVVAGNTASGIAIATSDLPVTLTGNRIGVAANGNPLPNAEDGIRISSGTGLRRIGTTAGPPNTIAHNGLNGVSVTAGGAVSILNNSIFDNGGLAIDLGPTGVTVNDALDADTGGNGLQNAPVLTSAVLSGGLATISGSLHSTPNRAFTIELYANSALEPANHGEAEALLSRFVVSTDVAGDATFTAPISPCQRARSSARPPRTTRPPRPARCRTSSSRRMASCSSPQRRPVERRPIRTSFSPSHAPADSGSRSPCSTHRATRPPRPEAITAPSRERWRSPRRMSRRRSPFHCSATPPTKRTRRSP